MTNNELVLVCIGPSPGSARLVRTAARLAEQLECHWIAAHVTPATPFLDEERARVESHLQLAEALGAEVARLAGSNAAETLVEYAKGRGVSRILVGRARRARWRELLFGSVFQDLLRGSGTVEVHVTVDAPAAFTPWGRPRAQPVELLIGVGLAAVVAAVADALDWATQGDVVIGFLLAIMGLGLRRGRPAALAAATTAAVYLLATPGVRGGVSAALVVAVGLAVGGIAERQRAQEAEAISRERRTATLLAFSRAVAAANGEAEVARVIVEEAARRIAKGARLVLRRADGTSLRAADAGLIPSDDEDHAVPIVVGAERLGLLLLYAPQPGVADLAGGFARQAGLALARARQAARAEDATLRARTEELRSALLSTVSHDLRTPLASITGAATALLQEDVALSEEARRELLVAVRDEAARMERLVGNLLEMTRIASGPVTPRREWVPLDELVGAAFDHVGGVLAGHTPQIDLADTLMIHVDPVLFEHVLVNLLENAARHTPPGTAIRLVGARDGDLVRITVSDEGPGWPPGDLERLFDPFVRGAPANVVGSGLGLAICRGIVEAHGGRVRLVRAPTGAAVEIELPTGQPPGIPEEDS